MSAKVNNDIIGLREIADLLNVKPRTPHIWKYRDLLPEPDYELINCSAAWNRSTIILWAAETNRLPDELASEAKKLAKAKAKG